MNLIFFLILIVNIVKSEEFFVSSVYGNDTNPGTKDRPFQTISRAQTAVRSITSYKEDVFVTVLSGEYREQLTFSKEDSGKDGKLTVYRSEQPGFAKLLGGLKIENWEAYATNIFRAFIGTGKEGRTLFIDGQRKPRAKRTDLFPSDITDKTDTGYLIAAQSEMINFQNQNRLEIVQNVYWKQMRCLVDKIELTGEGYTQITMQEPCWTNAKGSISFSLPSWIENGVELLTDEGEWYYNQDEGYIYLFTQEKTMENKTAEFSVVESIVKTNTNENERLENFVFMNFEIRYTTWNSPSSADGFPETQANICADGRSPTAAIDMSYVYNVFLYGNVFANIGGIGIHLSTGTYNSIIMNNYFVDISSHAIKLGDVNPFPSSENQKTQNNIIFNNTVLQTGREFAGAPAVMLGYTRNSTVIHNLIQESSYTGISNSWGWEATVSNYAGFNNFCWNHVTDSMGVLFDGGSFYTLGSQNGSVLSYNLFENSNSLYGSFYLDDGSRWWECHHNVIFGNVMSSLIKGGDHNLHDIYWQNRGTIEYQGIKKPDIDFENNGKHCGPCDPECKDCGPIVQENNHEIGSLGEAPPEILNRVGLNRDGSVTLTCYNLKSAKKH